MKNYLLIAIMVLAKLTVNAQSIAISNNSYHYYGPNSTWSEYLQVGGNGRVTNSASVVTTNGNLHLDSKAGFSTYINNYSLGNTLINTQGGFVGIGTTNPSDLLDIKGIIRITGTNRNWRIMSHTSDGSLYFRDESNTSMLMTLAASGNVGIGTIIPDAKLTVVGGIHAKEVKVSVNAGADFVFDDTYKPLTLSETEQFVKTNKHLPGIASESEMLKDGINLSEMNIKLLQKIEELTLHLIEMEKKNVIQNEKNAKYEKEILDLRSIIGK